MEMACNTYESVAGNTDVLELLHPSLTLLGCESSGNLLKDTLESLTLRAILRELAADEQIDGVALIGALSTLLPLDTKHTLVEAHPPVIGLVTSKSGAVNSGLLASSKTNDLAVVGVAHRVALGVLQSDGRNGQVTSSALGERRSVLGCDDCVEVLRSNLDIVAVLLEVDAVDGAGLGSRGVVLGVDLKDQVSATLLLLEDLKSSILVAGGNDTVRDLLGDDTGCRNVDNVAKSNHVAEAAHAIGTSGTSVCLSKCRLIDALNIVDKVYLLLIFSERQANSRTSGRDVLEAGSSGLAKSLLELLDKGPGVQSVEKVDVAGRTTKDLEGQVALADVGSSGLLVRVGTISEGAVLVTVTGVFLAEELRDGGIVVGSVLERLEGVSVTATLGDLALLELLKETSVVVGVAEDGNALVVLGGSTNQGNTTNINLLDGLGDADVDLGDGVLEGVKVADNIVDLVDVLLGKVLLIGGKVPGQNTGVDSGVESLDATSKHLGGLCDGRDVPTLGSSWRYLQKREFGHSAGQDP
ncbi:hypothetical protein HG530_004984 [Fusarium avenaceum]|nr:hypothetical protein HG530_004984 [Fusarium avenaceum]